jgi:hypothetical protein
MKTFVPGIVGLAGFALLAGGLLGPSAEAQEGTAPPRREVVRDTKAESENMRAASYDLLANRDRSAAAQGAPAVASVPAPAPARSPGGGSGGGGGAAAPPPAAPPAAAPPAVTVVPGAPPPSLAPPSGSAVTVLPPKSGGSGFSPAATPEPSALLLIGVGLAGLYRLRRRHD